MKSDNTLLVVSIIAVVVAAFALIFTVSNLAVLTNVLMAPTGEGTTRVQLDTTVSIVLVNNDVNFGSGAIAGGEVDALVNTEGQVLRGDWDSYVGDPFIVDNEGTVDVMLELKSANSADDFLGSTPGTASYQYKVSNGEVDSCPFGQQGTGWGAYADFVQAGNGDAICNQFNWEPSADRLEIDIQLVVPESAAKGSQLTDTITLTATGV